VKYRRLLLLPILLLVANGATACPEEKPVPTPHVTVKTGAAQQNQQRRQKQLKKHFIQLTLVNGRKKSIHWPESKPDWVGVSYQLPGVRPVTFETNSSWGNEFDTYAQGQVSFHVQSMTSQDHWVMIMMNIDGEPAPNSPKECPSGLGCYLFGLVEDK
jgi:hypothetical protein